MYYVTVVSEPSEDRNVAEFVTIAEADTFFWAAFRAGLTVASCNVSDCFGPDLAYPDTYCFDKYCAAHCAEYVANNVLLGR